jgi:hypothetical protein
MQLLGDGQVTREQGFEELSRGALSILVRTRWRRP